MKVILLQSVPKLGKKDAIVDVPEGYARNSLFPNRLAIQATPSAVAEHAHRLAAVIHTRELEHALLESSYQDINGKKVTLTASHTKEGNLFKKIVAKDIATEIERQFRVSFPETDLESPLIKKTGEYTVSSKLFPQYSFVLLVI